MDGELLDIICHEEMRGSGVRAEPLWAAVTCRPPMRDGGDSTLTMTTNIVTDWLRLETVFLKNLILLHILCRLNEKDYIHYLA